MRGQEPEAYPIPLTEDREEEVCSKMDELIHQMFHLVEVIGKQATAIQALADSNMMLVQAMAQDQGMDEGEEPRQYLDGSPVR